MSQDEQLGYIRGKVESVQEELSEFKDNMREDMKEHFVAEEEDRKAILKTLTDLKDRQDMIVTELTVYKRLFKGAIAVFTTVIALVWNDLLKALKGFF